MADIGNKQVKSKREMMLERLQNRYPDKDFSDDEAIFGQISDDVDEVDKELAGYKEREKAFSDMFTSDPRSAHFITSWREGENPVIAFVRRFGKDIKDVIEDPEWQKEVEEADKEFVARVAKEKEFDELYEKNNEESIAVLDKFKKERGLSNEQMGAVVALLNGLFNDMIVGKITAESLDMALKAINHDSDVEVANQEGLVQGKNTKVEEKLRKPKGGDGMPSLAGSGSAPAQENRRKSILEMALDEEKGRW